MIVLAIVAGVALALGAWPIALGCVAVLLWRLPGSNRDPNR